MNPRITVEQAGRELQEAILRRDSLKIHIQRLEQDIFHMTMLTRNIEQNIAILKDANIVPVASEYKKAKIELTTIENRLFFLRIDRSNHGKMLERSEKLLEEKKQVYDALMATPHGVVIHGKFGRDNGPK